MYRSTDQARCTLPDPAGSTRGFTLIEMIVSVGLFAIVMVVCVGALLSLVNANRKAQSLESVMNNLNIALDGMVRNIREGSSFHCGGGDYETTADCVGGDTTFAFEPYGNQPTDPPWVYEFVCPSGMTVDEAGYDVCSSGGYIQRSEDGGNTWLAITASEISIQEMEFYVVGTAHGGSPPDVTQPKVLIVIKGTAGVAGSNTQTTFHIQATAVQRVLDL